METILIIVGVILLFLTYKKLDSLSKFFEDRNYTKEEADKQQEYKDTNFQNWLYEDLKNLKGKVAELSDNQTIGNPAWGEDSATSRKKDNLIKLYVQHLVEKEKLSQKDALIKAGFVVNNFEGGVVDDIIRDINFHEKIKSEEELLMSDFFKKEVETKANSLKAGDIFEPLWVGIKNRKYKKGDELLQNTRKAFDSYSGQYGYQNYVEDSAIIYKLQELGIFGLKKKDDYSFQESQDRQKLEVSYDATDAEIKSSYLKLAKKYHPDNMGGNSEKFTEINSAYKNLTQKDSIRKTMSGHPFFVLKEDNLEKLREIIFAGDEQNKQYYDDAYFADKHPKDERFDMPFQQPFEH
ncbi:MAG: DnaJ domain-containing protein [Patescibacteria group bacterium]